MQFWMNYYRMNKDLANLKVLVTRPAHQAEPLCEAIAALGGLPVRLPLLAIEPLTPDARLRTQIQQLDNFSASQCYAKEIFNGALNIVRCQRPISIFNQVVLRPSIYTLFASA